MINTKQFPFLVLIISQLVAQQTSFTRVDNSGLSTSPAQGLALFDCNNDGFMDLASTAVDAAQPRFLAVNSGGTGFNARAVGNGNDGVSAADYNGDGMVDLAFEAQGQVELMISQGAADCSLFQNVLLNGFSEGAEGPTPIDLDLDGDTDIFFPGTNFAYFQNNGDGNFSPQTELPGAGPQTITLSELITCIDLDGNGMADCFYTQDPVLNVSDTLTWSADPANPGQFIYRGAGFYGLPGAFNPYEDSSFIWGDCNNDGLIDVYMNEGDGGFPTGLWTNTGSSITGPVGPRQDLAAGGGDWGDLDQDGDLDLILATPNGLEIFLNDGNCGFTQDTVLTPFPQSAAGLMDFDNDGDLDIVSSQGELWLNQHNGANFFKVRVRGGLSSPAIPFGAHVRLFAVDGTMLGYRQLVSTNSLFQPSEVMHFGVPEAANARYNIEIFFPTTQRTTVYAKCRPAGARTFFGENVVTNMFTANESDATMVSCTVPPTILLPENGVRISGNSLGDQVTVAHDDLGEQEMLTVSLSVGTGTVSLDSLPAGVQQLVSRFRGNNFRGVTRAAVQDQTTLTFNATLADVNTVLGSLVFSDVPTTLSLVITDAPTGDTMINMVSMDVMVERAADDNLTLIVAIVVPIGCLCLVCVAVAAVVLVFFVRKRNSEDNRPFQNQNSLYNPEPREPLVSHSTKTQLSIPAPQNAPWVIPQSNVTISESFSRGVYGEICSASLRTAETQNPIRAAACRAPQLGVLNSSFFSEAERVVSLRAHQNVAHVFGFLTDSDFTIVFEKNPFNLKDYLATHTIQPQSVVSLALGICSGMLHLHESKVMHGSLCTRAIWVTDNLEQIKVSDYGLWPLNKNLATGECRKFFPPEAFQGRDQTFQGDIWAFGLILLEVCSKKEPFPGLSISDLPQAFKTGLKPLPPPQMPIALQDVFKKCTSTNPSQRPFFLELVSTFSELSL